MYLNRIHIAAFLPFRMYNTDNQLIIDTGIVSLLLSVATPDDFADVQPIKKKTANAIFTILYFLISYIIFFTTL